MSSMEYYHTHAKKILKPVGQCLVDNFSTPLKDKLLQACLSVFFVCTENVFVCSVHRHIYNIL
jgi:hypothetical protein